MDKKKKKAVEKYNLGEVDDLWQSVLSEESTDDDDDDLFLDDLLNDEQYSNGEEEITDLEADDALYGQGGEAYEEEYPDAVVEDEQVYDELDGQTDSADYLYEETSSSDATTLEEYPEEVEHSQPEKTVCAAALDYIGGMQQEADRVRLFEPMENSLLLIDGETDNEQVIFFDQLTCLRISHFPEKISDKRPESCTREIIETTGGKVYNERVHPEQVLDNFLVCISSDTKTPYRYILFPESNIVQRTEDKSLADILLQKRFISRTMLQKALRDYEQFASITLERIIAQKARIPLAEIEQAIDQARQNQMQGLQKEEILLFSGLVSEEIILAAVEQLDKIQKLSFEQFLVDKGIVQENEVYLSIAEKYGIPFVALEGRKFSKKSLTSLPRSMIIRYEILPLAYKDTTLLVASHSAEVAGLSEKIVKTAGCEKVKFVLSPPSHIRKIIKVLFANRAK